LYEKFGSCSGPLRRTNFEFKKLGKFETEFEKNVANEIGAQIGSIVEKRQTRSVLDFGRPSISGSIRSIKMYSWT
jgi:hypothetical protein